MTERTVAKVVLGAIAALAFGLWVLACALNRDIAIASAVLVGLLSVLAAGLWAWTVLECAGYDDARRAAQGDWPPIPRPLPPMPKPPPPPSRARRSQG